MPKAEQLAERRSLEGNCEILRTIFQPRALSSDIPASRKGVYFAYFVHFFAFLCVVEVVKCSVTAFGEKFVFHDRWKGWLERLHVSWPLFRRSKTRRRIANRTTDIVWWPSSDFVSRDQFYPMRAGKKFYNNTHWIPRIGRREISSLFPF